MTTAERRDDLRRESCRSCGHVFSWPDESARRFTLARSTPRHAACSGPEGRRWCGCGSGASSTAAPRPWWAAIAFPKSPRTRHHALHAEPSPPACRRRLTPTPTGSRPARHPESGGLPRPVDGRDAPSRPGRKAHNCHPSRGADGVSPCTLYMTLRGWSREVGAGCGELPVSPSCVEHLFWTCAPAASHRWTPRGEFAPQSASTGTGRHRWRARSIREMRRSRCRQLGSWVSTGVHKSIRCA